MCSKKAGAYEVVLEIISCQQMLSDVDAPPVRSTSLILAIILG